MSNRRSGTCFSLFEILSRSETDTTFYQSRTHEKIFTIESRRLTTLFVVTAHLLLGATCYPPGRGVPVTTEAQAAASRQNVRNFCASGLNGTSFQRHSKARNTLQKIVILQNEPESRQVTSLESTPGVKKISTEPKELELPRTLRPDIPPRPSQSMMRQSISCCDPMSGATCACLS